MNSAAKRVQLFGRPDLLDSAAVEQHHPVRHFEGLVLVMGDEDRGDAEALLELAQLEAHPLAEHGVEIRQRFVEKEHGGLNHERAGESDPLTLPTAELAGQARLHTREPDHVEHPANPPRDPRARRSPHPEPERDIVEDGLVGEQRIVLEHQTHVAVLGIEPCDIPGAEHDAPLVGKQETSHDVQRGGLAAPARSQQREELALAHVDVDGPHAERRAVPLDHTLELEDRPRHGLRRCQPGARLSRRVLPCSSGRGSGRGRRTSPCSRRCAGSCRSSRPVRL